MKKAALVLALFFLIFNSISIIMADGITADTKSVQSIKTVMSFDSEPIKGEITGVAKLIDGSIVGIGSTMFGSAATSSYAEKRKAGDDESTALVFKFNANGSLSFLKTFGGNKADRFIKIIATSDGGFIAFGYSYSYQGGDFGAYKITGLAGKQVAILVKYDKSGNVKWAKSGAECQGVQFSSVSENSKGEIVGLIYGIDANMSSGCYLMKLDSGGKSLLTDVYVLLPNFDLTVSDLKLLDDGSFLVCGSKELPDKIRQGVLCRYTKDGKMIFTKTFTGNGLVSFSNMLLTSDNNIIVVGSATNCSDGKDFKSLNLKLPIDRSSSVGLILKYDLKGNILSGNTLGDYSAKFYYLSLRGLIEMENGGVLVQVVPGQLCSYFIDPISKKKIEVVPEGGQAVYAYRMDSNLNFEHLYKIESPNFVGPYSGISKFERLVDGTFRITSAGSSKDSEKVRILDVVDKFAIEKTLVSMVNIKKADYTTASWSVFLPKYNAAFTVLKSPSTTQKVTNTANIELRDAVQKLARATDVNASGSVFNSGNSSGEELSENISSEATDSGSIEANSNGVENSNQSSISDASSPNSSKDTTDNKKIPPAIWIGLVALVVIGGVILVYLIKSGKITSIKPK